MGTKKAVLLPTRKSVLIVLRAAKIAIATEDNPTGIRVEPSSAQGVGIAYTSSTLPAFLWAAERAKATTVLAERFPSVGPDTNGDWYVSAICQEGIAAQAALRN